MSIRQRLSGPLASRVLVGDVIGLAVALVRTLADTHGWTVGVGEAAEGGARFEFGGVRRQFPADGGSHGHHAADSDD